MARLPRLVIPQMLHHLVQRTHEGTQLFRDSEDYTMFLGWLTQGAKQFHIAIHAYVLMPEHLHLLVTPEDAEGLSKLLQWLGRYYVPYFNRKYRRSGSLWQGRYKATVLEAQAFFLPCSLYVESHPLRAGLVADLLDYPWSSYQHHIGLRADPLVSDHPIFWALGNTPFQREANYKEMMQQSLSAAELARLTEATHKGWLLGSPVFEAEMAKLTERRVSPAKRGRPRKIVPAGQG
ncbi:transposase [Undibacterium oligocarboniphilum]|uniref:Transposase n=1 Tax=Undibacterium oligocarboniphilum TaxID=666702 RepID=A0A850QG14_9BURK|nr:transposase [Undibacterium oligocarboniphilum]MBC3871074.1 transposase [Undibacterium oligocarboniphilum]NVO76303.1 transposase [Undibacterium oligocarboniphilum]